MLSQSRGKLFLTKEVGHTRKHQVPTKRARALWFFFSWGKKQRQKCGSSVLPNLGLQDCEILQDSSPTHIPTTAGIPVGAQIAILSSSDQKLRDCWRMRSSPFPGVTSKNCRISFFLFVPSFIASLLDLMAIPQMCAKLTCWQQGTMPSIVSVILEN